MEYTVTNRNYMEQPITATLPQIKKALKAVGQEAKLEESDQAIIGTHPISGKMVLGNGIIDKRNGQTVGISPEAYTHFLGDRLIDTKLLGSRLNNLIHKLLGVKSSTQITFNDLIGNRTYQDFCDLPQAGFKAQLLFKEFMIEQGFADWVNAKFIDRPKAFVPPAPKQPLPVPIPTRRTIKVPGTLEFYRVTKLGTITGENYQSARELFDNLKGEEKATAPTYAQFRKAYLAKLNAGKIPYVDCGGFRITKEILHRFKRRESTPRNTTGLIMKIK